MTVSNFILDFKRWSIRGWQFQTSFLASNGGVFEDDNFKLHSGLQTVEYSRMTVSNFILGFKRWSIRGWQFQTSFLGFKRWSIRGWQFQTSFWASNGGVFEDDNFKLHSGLQTVKYSRMTISNFILGFKRWSILLRMSFTRTLMLSVGYIGQWGSLLLCINGSCVHVVPSPRKHPENCRDLAHFLALMNSGSIFPSKSFASYPCCTHRYTL